MTNIETKPIKFHLKLQKNMYRIFLILVSLEFKKKYLGSSKIVKNVKISLVILSNLSVWKPWFVLVLLQLLIFKYYISINAKLLLLVLLNC